MNCHAFTGRACRTKSPEYSSLPRSAAGRAFNELYEPGRGRLGRGSCCHEKLRLTDATAPACLNTPSSFTQSESYGDEVAVVELVLRPFVRDSHISFCAL